jgi:integrase
MSRKKKKGRSRKGSGSVYQVNEQLWCGQCTVGHRVETGKPIRKKVYGATREEAEEKLHEEIRKYRGPDAQTSAEAEEERKRRPLKFDNAFWLDGEVKPKVDKATYLLHKQRIDDHLLPHLGSIPVMGLNQYLVKEWYEKLEQEGASSHLRNKVGQLLRRFLDRVMAFGWIKRNPARELPLPRVETKEMKPLTEEETRRFLAVAKTHRLYALWLLALDAGMRSGEIIALEWADVDLENGIVSVTKSARRDKGGIRVKDVKTKASRRRIRLTPGSVAALRQWRAKTPGKLVFPARSRRKDQYLDKRAIGRTFSELLKKAGVPPIRFHDLRHTHATLALLKTKNIKAVSSRLGHADITVTLNTYAHYLPLMEEELVSALESVFQPQSVNPQVATSEMISTK